MSLQHDSLVRILAPVWLGLLRAQLEVEAQLEAAEAQGGLERMYTVQELVEVRERLRYEAARYDFAGLNVVIQTGNRLLTWPNAYPTEQDRARVEADYLAKRPDLKALIERRKQRASERLEAALRQHDAARRTAEARLELSA